MRLSKSIQVRYLHFYGQSAASRSNLVCHRRKANSSIQLQDFPMSNRRATERKNFLLWKDFGVSRGEVSAPVGCCGVSWEIVRFREWLRFLTSLQSSTCGSRAAANRLQPLRLRLE